MNKLEKYNQQKNFVPEVCQPVLVTTEARGVFFGFLAKEQTDDVGNVSVTLTNARNCVYWSADVRGFLGLAISGPNRTCRVGPAAPTVKLMKVTSIVDCTQQAVDAWERGPWQS